MHLPYNVSSKYSSKGTEISDTFALMNSLGNVFFEILHFSCYWATLQLACNACIILPFLLRLLVLGADLHRRTDPRRADGEGPRSCQDHRGDLPPRR